jgi:biofilm protein TabA
MRQVAFVKRHNNIKKVMLYECLDGVYVFWYDCLQDTSSISDYLYETMEEAENFCKDEYEIDNDDWISIAEPVENCQHDFIFPTRVKGKENGNPEWGHFQTLVDGRWIEIKNLDKIQNFNGMTGNERLFVSGLLGEFDLAQQNDKAKAKKILSSLGMKEEC